MFRRGIASVARLWLAVLAAAPGLAAQPARPATALRVDVVLEVIVNDVELQTLGEELSRIWVHEGIAIDLVTSAPPGDRGVRLVLTDAAVLPSPATPDFCAMGSVRFVSGTPLPELRVSVEAIRRWVRRARPGQSPGLQAILAARIMGRVAAHELGHYLLRDRGHQPTGLMRASFDGAALLGPHVSPFVPPPRNRLAAGLARVTGNDPR